MVLRKGQGDQKRNKTKAVRMAFGPGSYVKSSMRNDFWGLVEEPRFEMYDYDGKVPDGVCCLKLEIIPVDPETYEPLDGEKPDVNYYGCGRGMKPVDDGKGFVSVKAAPGPPENTNLQHLMSSIADAGFPLSGDEEDITCLDGMIARYVREPQPKREGLDEGGKTKDFLLVQEVVKEDEEKPKKKKGGKGKSKSTDGKKSKTDPKVIRKLVRKTLRTMLADGDDIEIAEVETIAANYLVDENKSTQDAVYALLTDDGFLESNQERLEFTFDSEEGVISPGVDEGEDDNDDDDE